MKFQATLSVFTLSCLTVVYGQGLELPAGCGSDIGCYHDCDTGTCSYVVTWLDGVNTVDFSLRMDLNGGGDQWIALGLSFDKEMGTDSVTSCIQNGDSIRLVKSYNNPSPLDNSLLSTAFETDGLTSITTSVTGDVLVCSYTQTKTSNNGQIFNLVDDWFLMVATGSVSAAGSKNSHSFTDLPAISPDQVDFQSNDDLSGTAINKLIKAHGILMIIAWMFCVSIGIVVARYYKPMWPNTKPCGNQLWFEFHRVLMTCAMVSCVVGFVLVFAELKEWSHLRGSSDVQRAHPYLGVIVTALCITNPIMAVFRPAHDSSSRSLFNWAHWTVGIFAYVLAVVTLILGVTLGKAAVPFYCVWVMVAWAMYQMLVMMFLEIHEHFVAAGAKTRYTARGRVRSPRGSGLKTTVLVLHVLVITALTIACICIIAVPEY